MEKELNIAKILRGKPQGTLLHSDIYGRCKFWDVNSDDSVRTMSDTHINGRPFSGTEVYLSNGQFCDEGKMQLFPSDKMRDWFKFGWTKGTVLESCDKKAKCVFVDWMDDDYMYFKAVYKIEYDENDKEEDWLQSDESLCTLDYDKVDDEEKCSVFIGEVEKLFGGKLNLSTLEIEQSKPEFKDGDIVFVESPFIGIHTKSMIAILNKDTDDGCEFYLALCNKDYDGAVSLRTTPIILNRMQAKVVRPATDSEKQQLFDALAKEGKVWDAEKKAIVDLPKKCEFKPMDWCLMRDFGEKWKLCQFGFFEDDDDFDNSPYNAVGGNWYNECIPYNDSTKHLLGTTDEWEGGEG